MAPPAWFNVLSHICWDSCGVGPPGELVPTVRAPGSTGSGLQVTAEVRAEGLGSEPDCPAVTLGKRLNLSGAAFSWPIKEGGSCHQPARAVLWDRVSQYVNTAQHTVTGSYLGKTSHSYLHP